MAEEDKATKETVWVRPEEAVKILKDHLGSRGKITIRQMKAAAKQGLVKHKERGDRISIDTESLFALIERVHTGEIDLSEIHVIEPDKPKENIEPTPPKQNQKSKAPMPPPQKPYADTTKKEIEEIKAKLNELNQLKNNVMALMEQMPTLIEQHATKAATKTVQEATQEIMSAITGITADNAPSVGEQLSGAEGPPAPNTGGTPLGVNPSQIPPSVIDKQLQLELMDRLPKMQSFDKLLMAVSNPGFLKLLGVMKGSGTPQQSSDGGAGSLIGAMQVLSELNKMFVQQTVNTVNALKELTQASKIATETEIKKSRKPRAKVEASEEEEGE